MNENIDDVSALEKAANGEGFLSFIYQWQYVCNEQVVATQNGNECPYKLQKNHVLAATITGTVYHGDVATQTFVSDYTNNVFQIRDLEHEGNYPRITEVKISAEKGILYMNWDRPVEADKHKLSVNYEYDYCANHPI